MIDLHFYGSPIQSAYIKQADAGKQKVEWSTKLPQEGKYEVFFYHPSPHDKTKDPRQEFYYSVFDGIQEHEVVIPVNHDETGWISLGVFHFTKDAKVTLSDRDRKEKIESKYHGIAPQELTADAIKWDPTTRIDPKTIEVGNLSELYNKQLLPVYGSDISPERKTVTGA